MINKQRVKEERLLEEVTKLLLLENQYLELAALLTRCNIKIDYIRPFYFCWDTFKSYPAYIDESYDIDGKLIVSKCLDYDNIDSSFPRDEDGYLVDTDDLIGWYYHSTRLTLYAPSLLVSKLRLYKNILIEKFRKIFVLFNEFDVSIDDDNFLTISTSYNIENYSWKEIYTRYFVRNNDMIIPKLLYASYGYKPNISIGIRSEIIENEHIGNERYYVLDKPDLYGGVTILDVLTSYHLKYNKIITLEQWIDLVRPSNTSEIEFFNHYYNHFAKHFESLPNKNVQLLPALLPETYITFDIYTKNNRVTKNYNQQRVDFLLLFPNNNVVIIEIDGESHFSKNGKPSLEEYEDHLKKDRTLKLLGYEVFRIGNNEALSYDTRDLIIKKLFEKYYPSYSNLLIEKKLIKN